MVRGIRIKREFEKRDIHEFHKKYNTMKCLFLRFFSLLFSRRAFLQLLNLRLPSSFEISWDVKGQSKIKVYLVKFEWCYHVIIIPILYSSSKPVLQIPISISFLFPPVLDFLFFPRLVSRNQTAMSSYGKKKMMKMGKCLAIYRLYRRRISTISYARKAKDRIILNDIPIANHLRRRERER